MQQQQDWQKQDWPSWNSLRGFFGVKKKKKRREGNWLYLTHLFNICVCMWLCKVTASGWKNPLLALAPNKMLTVQTNIIRKQKLLFYPITIQLKSIFTFTLQCCIKTGIHQFLTKFTDSFMHRGCTSRKKNNWMEAFVTVSPSCIPSDSNPKCDRPDLLSRIFKMTTCTSRWAYAFMLFLTWHGTITIKRWQMKHLTSWNSFQSIQPCNNIMPS